MLFLVYYSLQTFLLSNFPRVRNLGKQYGLLYELWNTQIVEPVDVGDRTAVIIYSYIRFIEIEKQSNKNKNISSMSNRSWSERLETAIELISYFYYQNDPNLIQND